MEASTITYRLAFEHGLGDNVMLTSLLRQLRWHDPGCRIELAVRPSRVSLFDGLADEVVGLPHFFGLPRDMQRLQWLFCEQSYSDSPSSNTEFSLRSVFGMTPAPEAWSYHVNVDPAKRQIAREWLASIPRAHHKTAILHYRGQALKERKDLTDDQAAYIIQSLNARGYEALIWDANDRSPLPEVGLGQRIEEAPPLFETKPGDCGMLAAILAEADLVIGVDSGILHLASAVGTRAIGCWVKHHPLHFFCPDATTTHIIPKNDWIHPEHWLVQQPFGNGIPFFETHYDHRYAADTTEAVEEILEGIAPSRPTLYLDSPEHDHRLRGWLAKTQASRKGWGDMGRLSVDRHTGFDVLLTHMRGQSDPVIVETGTLRTLGNWAGDGNATLIFAAFLQQHGGELHSIDIHERTCEVARSWVREFGDRIFIHHGDSVQMLAEFERPIDVAYLDSMDADLPGASEHGLKESQAAAPLVKPGGLIAIDDTPEVGGKLHGKGALAAPWLESQGWETVYRGYQRVLRKP